MRDRSLNWRSRKWCWMTLLGVAVLLGACAQSGSGPATEPATSAAAEMRLPVSLNDVMVALVNHAADPIWVAAWKNPETDQQWRELERLAYQLEIAGALLPYPGTGPLDDEWTAEASWGDWANQLRQAGLEAVAAVQMRDIDAISAAGDRIVDVCEGCHFEFKPDLPTGGKFGELSPTAADLEDEQ